VAPSGSPTALPSLIGLPETWTAVPTQLPTATPEPTRAEIVEGQPAAGGPWLLGADEGGIVVLNVDGTGRTVLQGPPLWDLERDIAVGDGVSPMGWIAARTGVPNDWTTTSLIGVSAEAIPPAQVGIALWDLPREQPRRVISRFSDELLLGMQEIRDFELPYGEQATGPRWTHDMVFISLLHEDARLFWSPDGRLLAFAAALDGPSADVYVYDTQVDEIRRLTDGPNQAVLLGWSPDGKWILHYEASEYAVDHGDIIGFPAEALWAAAADGSQVRRLGDVQGIPWVAGWLSPNTVVLIVWGGGSSLPHKLWSIDINTGVRMERQDLSFYSVAVDPASDTIAVNAESLIDSDGFFNKGGLFVFQPGDGDLRNVGSGEPLVCTGCGINWSEGLGLFFVSASGYDEQPEATFGFLPSGDIRTRYEGEISLPLVSPDSNWLAFSGSGVQIYDSEGLRIQVSGGAVYDMIWSADSTGLFYLEDRASRTGLMFVSVPGGTPTVLHPDIGLQGLHLVQNQVDG